MPIKTVYPINGNLKTYGLVLEVVCENGQSATVSSGYEIGEYDFSTPGEKTITVSYMGKEISFTVTVDENFIEYPESDHPYANYSDKWWTYVHGTAADGLEVTFSENTKTESGYDKICIYDLNDAGVGTYSGTSLAGKTIFVPGNGFYIGLKTDGSITYYGFDILNIKAVNIESLSVSSLPTKTVYPINGVLNTKGFGLTVTYDNGNTQSITTGYEIGEYDFSTPGEKTITVSYMGKEISFTVTVDENYVEYPESDHPYANNINESWTYVHGTAADGLEVTFSENTKTESDYDYIYIYDSNDNQIGKYSGTQLAGKTVLVSGNSFKIELTSDYSNTCYGFSINNIKAINVVSLSVASLPSKTVYPIGGTLKTSGLELEVVFDDGSTKNISSGYEIGEYDFSTPGEKTITVSYMGKEISFTVTVDENLVEYPESDHPYANNTDKSWTYVHRTTAEALEITFSEDTETESGYDYIYIYDSNDSQIGKYSGTQLSGKTVTVPGNSFRVRLTSDGSYRYYGFAIDSIEAVHTHTLTTVDAVEANCTQTGNIEYYICSICNKLFSDSNATEEITIEDTVIPTNGQHIIDESGYKVIDNTYYECESCKLCDYEEVGDEIISLLIDNYLVDITRGGEISVVRFAPGHFTTPGDIKRATGCITLTKTDLSKNISDGMFEREMVNGGEYSFYIKLSDGSEFIFNPVLNYFTQELSSVDNNLTVSNLYGVSDIFFCLGYYDTYSEVKANHKFRVTASKINGAKSYTYAMPGAGEVTVYVKYTDTTRPAEFYYSTLTTPTPTITQDGLNITIDDLTNVKCIKRVFGTYTTSAQVKATAGVITYGSSVANGTDTATLHIPHEGALSVMIQYKSGYTTVINVNIEQKRPSVVQNGNKVTFGNLDDMYVIRYAKGIYLKTNAIKAANGSKVIRSSAIEDGNIVIENLEKGTYTFLVQYNDESINLYTVTVD